MDIVRKQIFIVLSFYVFFYFFEYDDLENLKVCIFERFIYKGYLSVFLKLVLNLWICNKMNKMQMSILLRELFIYFKFIYKNLEIEFL